MWRTLLVLLMTGGLALGQNNPSASAGSNGVVAKFRAAVRLPQVAFNLEPQFGRYWGVTTGEDFADPGAELARLATGLKNEPNEAPIRLRMLRLALLVGDTNAAAHRDAAVVGFQALAKSTPGDPAPGIGLARTLLLAADEVPAEKLLRILTEKHPKNWEAWILLGEALGSRSLKVFTAWGTNAPANPMAAYVAGALKPQGDLKAARSLFDEANQCLGKAEKLAPDEPRMWAARLPFMLDREMRRQVLAPIADYMRDRDQRRMHLADIACGTGRFLEQGLEVYPRLEVTGIDLSAAYLDEARDHLRGIGRARSAVRLMAANAENIPLADASLDIVTVIFLFHELPAPVHRRVAHEMARILKE